MKTFYVTTPIYYANSLPHLGSLYTTLVADALTRYKRQRGFETYFLTGTDEHGINIQRAAERTGRTSKEHTDHIAGEFQKVFSMFGLDTEHGGYDIFMRTTEPFHYAGVSELWRRVAAARTPKGREPIYKGHYEGWFCASCATFKTEDEYIKPEREGDPPRCLEHLIPLDRVSEESYFFRLSDYAEALIDLYESRPDFIRPETRRNEVLSFVRGGLQDLAVSRLKSSVSWAIPVPDDPSHTIWVWFDALPNYITAIGFGSPERERIVGFEKFWPALHLVGKDILRQHAIYWPAFLLAAGLEPPRMVFAHGMWQDATGRRMSKTLGNVIDLDVLHRYFSNDMVRYYCLREMNFGQDGKFGYETLIERVNSDLAGGLGNLLARTQKMIQLYSDGRIPSPGISEDKYLSAKRAGIDPDPMALVSVLEHAREQFITQFDELAFSRALESAWAIIARVDKMISDAKPWELAKDEGQRQTLNAILYRAAESLRWLAVILQPVMPETAAKIYAQLGLADSVERADPSQLEWGTLPAGTVIGEGKPLFPRIDKAKIMAEIEKTIEQAEVGAHATEADAVAGAPGREQTKPLPPMRGATEADAVAVGAQAEQTEGIATYIEIGDFARVELRAGEILTAERVPKSDKLLRFTIDLGEPEPRQVLAGIAEYYEPEKMIGRKVVVVANLKPRKLRGYESQGMILAASIGEEGRPVIATFTEDVPNGARLK
ncbi:MAG TPA: methionine--tRNA ligase [Pyrinomonadaceae bacterium]|jgi:methionyl-tRNA synthetase|nr:methionine--tRNA ligase [Pyrinomonadaceae bacterium]